VADGFNKLSATLEPAIVRAGIQPFLKSVQVEAQRRHRYHRRTGKLGRAVKISYNESGGDIYIDDASAPYGKYVHEGTRYWDSDPFLTDAYDRKSKDLDAALSRATDQAINQAINQAGL